MLEHLDVSYIQPAVAFVYNGIVVPRYGTTGLIFDLDSVQVISGPQGTLYGGSVAGGAIDINSARSRNNTAGDGLLEAGAYGEVHAAVNQNIPLGDKVSVRGSVDYERHDGYQTRGFDDEDMIRGRLSLLAKPTSDVTALIFFSGYHDGGNAGLRLRQALLRPLQPLPGPGRGPVFGNPLSSTTSFRDFEDYVIGANIEWKVAGNTFTYIPGSSACGRTTSSTRAAFP